MGGGDGAGDRCAGLVERLVVAGACLWPRRCVRLALQQLLCMKAARDASVVLHLGACWLLCWHDPAARPAVLAAVLA